MPRRDPGEKRTIAQTQRAEVDFRSGFGPIQEVGCTACFRVSDTRCGTCVILPAFLQSRCSPDELCGGGCNCFAPSATAASATSSACIFRPFGPRASPFPGADGIAAFGTLLHFLLGIIAVCPNCSRGPSTKYLPTEFLLLSRKCHRQAKDPRGCDKGRRRRTSYVTAMNILQSSVTGCRPSWTNVASANTYIVLYTPVRRAKPRTVRRPSNLSSTPRSVVFNSLAGAIRRSLMRTALKLRESQSSHARSFVLAFALVALFFGPLVSTTGAAQVPWPLRLRSLLPR